MGSSEPGSPPKHVATCHGACGDPVRQRRPRLFGRTALELSEHRSGLGRPADYFFGLYITGALKLTFLSRYIQPQIGRKPAGVLGSAFVGTAFAAGWTPCVGPILGSILALAASAGQVKAGIILLLSSSLGLGIPFFLSAIAFDQFFALSQRFRWAIHVVYVSAGLLLIAAGLLLVTEYMTIVNVYALRLTPQWLASRL